MKKMLLAVTVSIPLLVACAGFGDKLDDAQTKCDAAVTELATIAPTVAVLSDAEKAQKYSDAVERVRQFCEDLRDANELLEETPSSNTGTPATTGAPAPPS